MFDVGVLEPERVKSECRLERVLLHVGDAVAVLMLAQRPLEFDVVGALESRCLVGD